MSKYTSIEDAQKVLAELENNIKETKQVIQEQNSQEIFDDFMDTLSKELFK